MKILNREDVKKEYTWDLSKMYSSLKEWEKDYEYVKDKIDEINNYKGKVIDSGENILKTLKLYEDIFRKADNIYSYSSNTLNVDTTNNDSQELADKGFNLYTYAVEKTAFITPEILKINEDRLKEYIKNTKGLDIYKQYFDDILRSKEHTLSSREEAIMAKVADIASSSQNTFSMLSNADLTFPNIKDESGKEVELTEGNFISYLESRNRNVRKNAFKTIYKVYNEFKNTFASTLVGDLKYNLFNAEIRNYRSSRHASLDANNIPENVYDNLLESVNENLTSLHKYIDIRKKALELDKIHMYDLYTPIVSNYNKKYSYEEGIEIVKNALKPLGKEYNDAMNEGFNSRWIDVYENKGKRSGAYSSGTYDSYPYILLNYKNNLDSVFTLAHEMGHSMHSYLTHKYQPYIYGNYSIFLAEVASTTNELLLLNYMLKNAKDISEKKYLLNHYLESFRTTVFRQSMFAEFEYIINNHLQKGGALTAEYLSKEYRKLNRKYYGDTIIVDDEISLEWARIPHFYYNYYVFQYATGFSAAVTFSDRILNGEKEDVEKYLNFLKSGSSKYPIEILSDAGIDMKTRKPIDEAMKVFSDLVKEFDKMI